MSVVRIHRYSVDPANLEELLSRRAALIASLRTVHPGLVETRLIRLEDGTYTDAWRWRSAEQMRMAFVDLAAFPEARAAMSLTRDATAQSGEIVDER
jgi:hypothetical protein